MAHAVCDMFASHTVRVRDGDYFLSLVTRQLMHYLAFNVLPVFIYSFSVRTLSFHFSRYVPTLFHFNIFIIIQYIFNN